MQIFLESKSLFIESDHWIVVFVAMIVVFPFPGSVSRIFS